MSHIAIRCGQKNECRIFCGTKIPRISSRGTLYSCGKLLRLAYRLVEDAQDPQMFCLKYSRFTIWLVGKHESCDWGRCIIWLQILRCVHNLFFPYINSLRNYRSWRRFGYTILDVFRHASIRFPKMAHSQVFIFSTFRISTSQTTHKPISEKQT